MSIQEQVSKSLDQIRQEMFDRLAAKQEEYAASGWLPIRLNLNKGIVRGLIELWCWGLWQLYQFLAVILVQAIPDSATGLWLDLHCRSVGITRRPQTKATGTIYFTRLAAGGNVPIPAGRVVRTLPDGTGRVYRFVTMGAVVLVNGTLEVAVTVAAEEYGAAANVSVGQISEIVTVIPGVDGVGNRAGWLTTEGTDSETDEPLRLRYQLAWKQLNGTTKYAYQAWALAVTGVARVKILDQHPRGEGTVDVLIVGTAGLPTQSLLDAVTANILGTGAGDEKIPINDNVVIRGPAAISVAVNAQLVLVGGDPVTTLATAENRVRALFATVATVTGITPVDIGSDITRDRLRWAMMLPNVKLINFTAPAVDVTAVADDCLAVLDGITLTWVWATEA